MYVCCVCVSVSCVCVHRDIVRTMLYAIVLIILTVARYLPNIANILVALDDPRPGIFPFRARAVEGSPRRKVFRSILVEQTRSDLRYPRCCNVLTIGALYKIYLGVPSRTSPTRQIAFGSASYTYVILASHTFPLFFTSLYPRRLHRETDKQTSTRN